MSRQRTRSRGTINPAGPLLWTREHCASPDHVYDPFDYGVGNGDTEVTNDWVHPGFAKRSADGEIISSPFHSVKTKESASVNSCRVERSIDCNLYSDDTAVAYGGNILYAYPNGKDAMDAAPDLSVDLNNQITTLSALVSTRALAGVSSPEVHGLVFMAELSKTIRLLKSPIKALDKSFKKIRRSSKYRRARSRARRDDKPFDFKSFMSDNWLTYRYGIMPLIYDMDGTMKAFDKASKARPARHTSRSSDTYNTSSTASNEWTSSGWFNIESEGRTQANCVVRAGVLYEHVGSVANDLGLELQHVPAAAWEVVPFSFVADWFANIGDYINAITPKAGVRVLSSWCTYRADYVQHVEFTNASFNSSLYPGWSAMSLPSGTFTRSQVVKDRKIGIEASLVSKTSTINFEKPKDWLHLADSIALINQSLKYR